MKNPPRHKRTPKQTFGPNGEWLCRQCCGPVPKGRFTFCSQACVDLALVGASATWARESCWKRDKGVCAICGRDSEKDFKAFKTRYLEASEVASWLEGRDQPRFDLETRKWIRPARESLGWAERKKECQRIIRTFAPDFGGWNPKRKSGWDADHIVEVVRGGGSCGIGNLQTLCTPCHRLKTARLAAERAAERRSKQQSASEQLALPGIDNTPKY